jgi:hypothetical protein
MSRLNMSSVPPSKRCPDCGVEMDREDRGYVYLWHCDEGECGNAESYWQIYDLETFAKVEEVQREVGQEAAERLAAEFDDGVLA